MLEVRTQRPAHHLEGDQVVGDTELPRDGTNPPNEEILPLSWYRLPFALSPPEGWEHQSLGRSVLTDGFPGFDDQLWGLEPRSEPG
jgi:hypothetical protein